MIGNRGLIVTGVVFAFVILLVLAANYIVLTDKNRIQGDYDKMAIDKTYNRHIDVNRIIEEVVNDSLLDGADCTERANLIDTRLQTVLSDPRLDAGSMELDFTKTVNNGCGSSDQITVNVDFEVNYVDTAYLSGTLVHMEDTYGVTVPGG
jgi:hypothetical protein